MSNWAQKTYKFGKKTEEKLSKLYENEELWNKMEDELYEYNKRVGIHTDILHIEKLIDSEGTCLSEEQLKEIKDGAVKIISKYLKEIGE